MAYTRVAASLQMLLTLVRFRFRQVNANTSWLSFVCGLINYENFESQETTQFLC